jgi:uncharacterized protein
MFLFGTSRIASESPYEGNVISRQSRRTLPMTAPRLAASCLLLCGALVLCGADTPVTVSWGQLQTLNSDLPLAKQTAAALQFDGKMVSIPGFMVPLEDDADNVTEFLLVPFAGACIHVPPPPPNQMVYIKMNPTSKVKVTFVDPIVVTGVLKISTTTSPYGDVSYNMAGIVVKPYKE